MGCSDRRNSFDIRRVLGMINSDANILIWGAGAIGGTIGAYLIRAGMNINFVDVDAEHVKKINENGISIQGPIEEFNVSSKAYLPDQISRKYAAIWLCTKAQHTLKAVKQIKEFLSKDGYVLSLQNGLNEITIAKEIGESNTLGAFINFGADYLEPGRILYGGKGAVVVGELSGKFTERANATKQLLANFDSNTELTSNIWGYLWGKLGYGSLLFATALTNDSIADVLDMTDYHPVLTALAIEMTEIADAKGVQSLGFNGYDPKAFRNKTDPEKTLSSFKAMVAHNRKSAKTHSGIWRDLAIRKRQTEVDPQLTLPIKIGEELGFNMRLTRCLVKLIQDIENGQRELSLSNLDELNKIFKGR